ncbi:zinc finger, CCHC-type containing protein [Tanacetum coccineum]|uniref:Zinc finger, CCHC-type containing protein n=1 Tax=Tanacetum coccineum TaxID=301880 RepID=A0ABQ5AL93_9ASTR
MAGNTVKDMTMNFGKLDKFKGHDLRRWQKKMHFLLTTLKVVYVLTTPMLEWVEDATMEAIQIRAKWKNDDYICRGHILNDNDKGKGKKVGGPSVNMIEEGKNKHNKQNKGKKRSNENNSGSSSNKKPKLECWKCGKTGHFKRDCRSGIIQETTAPYTPQQNGVAERKIELLRNVNTKLFLTTQAVVRLPDTEKEKLGVKKDPPSNGCKTTFLNGDLDEEVYMKQPKGFVMPGNEHKCVYSKFDDSGKGVIICLYVDDMLIFGTDQNQVDKTKKFLSSMFSMKDMGEADVILGIKIKHENKGIVITQSHYIDKILKKFNREDCSSLEYSRVIGCLMYAITSTRPDISYVVGRLSWFTSNPSRQHWKVITSVFKYSRGTINYGLSYVVYPSVLEAYSDASWINHVEDSSSTSEWVFLLGGGAISWASKKQTCITGSTMESELVALAVAGKEAKWLRNLIHEIPICPKPIAPMSIRCDSTPTMSRAYSQIYNRKSRHLGIRHNMVRELIRNCMISIEFVRTQHNLANHLMKGLARDLVYKSVIRMGLKSI